MTLKKCLELGMDCGLETVHECIWNIVTHVEKFFSFDKTEGEINQLKTETRELYANTNFVSSSHAKTVLEWINIEDDGIDTEGLNS